MMDRPLVRGSFAALWMSLLLLSCDSDTITNEIAAAGGDIYGRVTPAEAGTEVAAWQANLVQSTTVDSEGYFSLSGLPAGLYKVVMQAPSGLRRELRDVAVDRTHSVDLGVVLLTDIPSMFLGFNPAPGDSSVSLNSSVSFTTTSRVSVPSLSEAVIFSPPLEGSWYEYGQGPGIYRYTFFAGSLAPFTTYEVRFEPGLSFTDGTFLGETYAYEFGTTSFRMTRIQYVRTPPVHPLYSGQFAYLEFDAAIDVASAMSAIRIEPGVTIEVDGFYPGEIYISILDGLLPGEEYNLILDASLRDQTGTQMGIAQTIPFETEGFQLSDVRFGAGNGAPLPPGSDLTGQLTFNAEIDVNALNAASSFSPPVEGIWIEESLYRGTSNQGHRFGFFPTAASNLVPEQVYEFRILGTVALNPGLTLGSDRTATFTVAPVSIASVSPRNGTLNVGTSSVIGLGFNAAMDHVSTEAAFSLREVNGAPVAGSFTWGSTSTGVQFRPTVSLQSDRAYVISVANTATSTMGPALKEGLTSYFRTR